MRFRNLSIVKKTLLLLTVPLVYQALLLGFLLKRQQMQTQTQQMVVHTKEVLGRMGELTRAMLTLQAAFQGFALTGNASFSKDAEGAMTQIPLMIGELKRLTQDSATQQQNLARIEQTVTTRLAWHREVSEMFRDGRSEEAMERIRKLEGKQIMDSLRAEIDTFLAIESGYDRDRVMALQRTSNLQDQLMIGGLVISAAIGLGTVTIFGRNVGRRIGKLSENSRRLVSGETLLAPMGGRDELGMLDATFHEMAKDLSAGRARERAAQFALQRRATELERVNRDLDHKNQENEMFVYSVSHDLRSPLVNLQGFSKELGLVRDDLRGLFNQAWTEQARERAVGMVDRDITESIHYIQTAVMRLSSIIDALLRLSRVGRVDYQPVVVELGAIIQRIVIALRGSIAERGATLRVLELPPVWADPTAIEQVFANLLANAVHYLDPKRPGEIEVGFCETPPPGSEGLPTYYVRDNGLGIAEAYLPKVFAIFQRLHAQHAQGEGVGLTLVKRMVERHGGRIWVESEVNAGSTFFVALPPREESPLVVAPRKESTRVKPTSEL